jgi:hypothetical protein
MGECHVFAFLTSAAPCCLISGSSLLTGTAVSLQGSATAAICVTSINHCRSSASRSYQTISPLVSMVWNRPLIVWPDIRWTAIREPSVKANVSNAWRNCDDVISSSLPCSLLRQFAAIEPGQFFCIAHRSTAHKAVHRPLAPSPATAQSLFAESPAIVEGTRRT